MNISVTFHITIRTWNTRKLYRMLVEHYYSSVQVERFRIKGKGDREIVMEKKLNINSQPWKITQGDIQSADIQEAAMAIRDMQDAIDNYLEARKTNPQNEGYVSFEDIKRELEKKNKK